MVISLYHVEFRLQIIVEYTPAVMIIYFHLTSTSVLFQYTFLCICICKQNSKQMGISFTVMKTNHTYLHNIKFSSLALLRTIYTSFSLYCVNIQDLQDLQVLQAFRVKKEQQVFQVNKDHQVLQVNKDHQV